MKRIWFKARMRDAILAGTKESTARQHPLKTDTKYLAVSGSRFKAMPFAEIEVWHRIDEISSGAVFDAHWKTEGFDSSEDCRSWILKELPQYLKAPVLYLHFFKVLSVLDAEEVK